MKRKRIAIQYKVNYSQATSIPIYIQNLIKAFNLLEDNKKPEIILVFQEDAPIDDLRRIGYPHIKYLKEYKDRAFFQKVIQKLWSFVSKKKIWIRKYWHPFYPKTDLSFPFLYFDNERYSDKHIFWVVDMQQLIYPDFFPTDEIEQFKDSMEKILAENTKIMFSSVNSYNIFKANYPQSKNSFTILPFSSIIDFEKKDEQLIRDKYNLNGQYFITPNQFWPHKNHITILKACKELLNYRNDFKVVFTGKTSSYRNENIYSDLKEYVDKNNLNDNVIFLGFVDRDDLFNLMQYTNSIIQPSLFEGWSTLVEEAKALNKFILLSDLPIHREQITSNCSFFEELDYLRLAQVMNDNLSYHVKIEEISYTKNINQFLLAIEKTFEIEE